MEIKVENLNNNYDKGFKNWHKHLKYSLNGFYIRCSDMIGGCGASNLYNWSNYKDKKCEDIEEVLLRIEKDLKRNGVGCIFVQVGDNYYKSNFTKSLRNLNYKYNQYINYRHGNDCTQRMYYKKL